MRHGRLLSGAEVRRKANKVPVLGYLIRSRGLSSRTQNPQRRWGFGLFSQIRRFADGHMYVRVIKVLIYIYILKRKKLSVCKGRSERTSVCVSNLRICEKSPKPAESLGFCCEKRCERSAKKGVPSRETRRNPG